MADEAVLSPPSKQSARINNNTPSVNTSTSITTPRSTSRTNTSQQLSPDLLSLKDELEHDDLDLSIQPIAQSPEDKFKLWFNSLQEFRFEPEIRTLCREFPPKEAKPTEYHQMYIFWKRVIEKYAVMAKKNSFTVAELQQVFKIPTKAGNYFPMGLDVVMMELQNEKVVETEEKFLQKGTQSWGQWFLKSFAFRAQEEKLSQSTRLYFLPTIYEKSEALQKEHMNQCVLVDKLTDTVDDYLIVEEYLLRKKKAFTFEIGANRHKFIKFGTTSPTKVEQMIVFLELISGELEAKIKVMEQQVSKLEKDAIQLKLSKRMKEAVSCMKRRQRLKDIIVNRYGMADNLHELTSKLQSSGDVETVFKAVQDGRNALQGFFKETGLDPDAVLDEMDKVRDALVNVDEVQTALAEPSGATILSDVDVEEEFEELMKSMEAEKHETLLSSMPSVPTEAPLKRKPENSNVFRVPQLEDDKDSSQLERSSEKRKKLLSA